MFKKSLELREKSFAGNSHPEIADSLSGMGYLFGTLGMNFMRNFE